MAGRVWLRWATVCHPDQVNMTPSAQVDDLAHPARHAALSRATSPLAFRAASLIIFAPGLPPTTAARSAPAPAPSAPDQASDGRADGTSRSTSHRASCASSTSECRSSNCTMRRAPAGSRPTCSGSVGGWVRPVRSFAPLHTALSCAQCPSPSRPHLCPPQPFGGTLRILVCAPVPMRRVQRRTAAPRPSRLSLWKSGGVRCGSRRSRRYRFTTPTTPACRSEPSPQAAQHGYWLPCSSPDHPP